MDVCVQHGCLVLTETRRRQWIPWNQSCRVGCRNQTWVLCKSTQCLETLSYFSSPKNIFLFLLYLEALVPTNILVIFVFVHLSPIYLFSHSTTLVDKTSNVHKLIYLPPYPSPSLFSTLFSLSHKYLVDLTSQWGKRKLILQTQHKYSISQNIKQCSQRGESGRNQEHWRMVEIFQKVITEKMSMQKVGKE